MNELHNMYLITLALAVLLIVVTIVCLYLLKENVRLREEQAELRAYCREIENKAWKLVFGVPNEK